MANVHVGQINNGIARLVCHVAIPAGSNNANPAITYASAALKSGIGGTTILPDGDGTDWTISATEKTSIQAGTLVEVVKDVPLGDDWAILTGGQKLTRLDSKFTQVQTDAQAELTARLNYFGFVR